MFIGRSPSVASILPERSLREPNTVGAGELRAALRARAALYPPAVEAPSLQPFLDEAPVAWSVALAVVTLGGAVLWVAGGRLARAGVALGGFLVGGIAATTAAAALEPGGGWVIGLGVGGALAGTLLAFLLYRLWVGLLAGVLLAGVVPVTLLLWGVDPPDTPDLAEAPAALVQTPEEATPDSLFGVFDGERAEGEGPVVDEAVQDFARERIEELGAEVQVALGDFFETASAAWKAQVDSARERWAALPLGTRRTVIVGAVGGFVIGLLLGLALPNLSAAFQTSLVGACLLTGGGLLLLQRHAGLFREAAEGEAGGFLPGVDPRALLLAVGLVTLIGLLLQWTLARRRADA